MTVLRKDIALGVGIASHIQPVPAPPFAIARRGQQAIDEPGERVGRGSRSNASISSAVGGMPQRSIVARRIKVRLSARAEGVIPAASSRARMNASTGVSTQFRSLTGGRDGRREAAGTTSAPLRARGHRLGSMRLPCSWSPTTGPPARPIAGGSRPKPRVTCRLGGIFNSSWVWATAWTSRLSSGFAGTSAGPLSPPLSAASRLSSRRLDDCFFGPWHLMHWSTRIGRTRDSKKSIASGERVYAAAFFGFVSSAAAG